MPVCDGLKSAVQCEGAESWFTWRPRRADHSLADRPSGSQFILVGKNHADFQSSFNRTLAPISGQSNTFAAVMKSAKHGGFATAPFSLYWTLIPITWIYLELVFNQSSAYIGGEVKRPGKVQLWSMP